MEEEGLFRLVSFNARVVCETQTTAEEVQCGQRPLIKSSRSGTEGSLPPLQTYLMSQMWDDPVFGRR